MNILLTGGSGLLGTELQKHLYIKWAPTHKEMDICSIDSVKDYCRDKEIQLIIHCAAYTAVEKAEVEKDLCWQTNVIGTRNMSSIAEMMYISTEYVFDGKQGNYKETDTPNPQNFYSLTKLVGESVIDQITGDSVVRCVFKPSPWKYDAAFTDQWTSGDYVDVIANEISLLVDLWITVPNIIHIGTGRKSIYELASRTRPVKKNSRKISSTPLPKDVSLDTSLWKSLKGAFL